MQLTRYTDYSLRVLIFLALQEGGQRTTINAVVEHFNISRNHLLKVVHNLGKQGFVDTLRGKGGGLCLAKPAQNIGIGEVVRRTEANLEPVDCLSTQCPLLPGCQLTRALYEARDAFLAVLDGYTLADLVKTPSDMRRLLGLKEPTP